MVWTNAEADARPSAHMAAIEACGSARAGTRQFPDHSHEVQLIAPQFVNSYVKLNKNDEMDADAIYEVAQHLSMQFTVVKRMD